MWIQIKAPNLLFSADTLSFPKIKNCDIDNSRCVQKFPILLIRGTKLSPHPLNTFHDKIGAKGEINMSSEALEHLPKSARLLVDFVQYCEIKRDCPHLSEDEQGVPKCLHRDSNGECKFENCPRIGKGATHE